MAASGPPTFHELAELVQEGIDGARLALDRALAEAESPTTYTAIVEVARKLTEAELWLGRAVETEAVHVPSLKEVPQWEDE